MCDVFEVYAQQCVCRYQTTASGFDSLLPAILPGRDQCAWLQICCAGILWEILLTLRIQGTSLREQAVFQSLLLPFGILASVSDELVYFRR